VLIDWFTVAAQALNFLILVWLMKRVLYKPIMSAIDAREALVAAELADAASKKSLADKAVEEFKSKNEAFDRDRAALLDKATEEAKARGAQLLDAARTAADALQSKRRAALQREMEDSSEALGTRTQQAFFSLARRAFTDLANGNLEEQMTALFCARLRSLQGEEKSKLSVAIETSADPVCIRSAFALPPKQQSVLQAALNETFQRQIQVRYEVAPALIGGIDLTAQGQRVVWSIADYIGSLEHETAKGGSSTGHPALTAAA
jgi:F-type H+-transporting ATPase subunit b